MGLDERAAVVEPDGLLIGAGRQRVADVRMRQGVQRFEDLRELIAGDPGLAPAWHVAERGRVRSQHRSLLDVKVHAGSALGPAVAAEAVLRRGTSARRAYARPAQFVDGVYVFDAIASPSSEPASPACPAAKAAGTREQGRCIESSATIRSVTLDLDTEFRSIIEALEREDIDYAVVGALALAIHGAPRATSDIDLLVLPDELDRILEVVEQLGYDMRALPMKFSDGMQLQRVTRIEEGDAVTLDLILVDDNLDPVWATRTPISTRTGSIRVISRDALIAMKLAAGRTRDIADVERLREMDR
jgi:hypothetical protein